MALNSTGVDERRLQERFQVQLPVKLDNATGTARDISVSGIYFYTSRRLRQGKRIRISFSFEHVYPSEVLNVQCEGQVVRIDTLERCVGVAARIFSCQVRRVAARLKDKRGDIVTRTAEGSGSARPEPDMNNENPPYEQSQP